VSAQIAKVRAKIRRQIAEVEEAEHEGGEINLVPYLDIVTNTVIFMLATYSASVILHNINVSAPRYAPPSASAAAASSSGPKDKKLNLTVAVSNKGFIVAGSGGVFDAKAALTELRKNYPGNAYIAKRFGGSSPSDGELPTIGCTVPLKAERCPAYPTKVYDKDLKTNVLAWTDKYDYKSLVLLLKAIKKAFPHERQVVLSADRNIPYQVVVRAMDFIRGKQTKECNGTDGCLFDQVVLSAGVQ
jgi:biopolymer transport protein ExbD